ncbi:MAG: dienelactone hydrolase family [Lasallia pustulata]|uniref:Dienelactone hydrolase family n=1 Tax=Lasallia pustulata TaxID=136370 RepID=A0A5M8PVV4_9LECA|nr:MAG: dienelactone hydrolase family [Lasallia pustulata]
MAQHGHSDACCNIPPIVAKGYSPKGKYIDIDGMKTYTTGPSTAKEAILVIYDIFGFGPQTLQGADILAHSDESHQYQIFIPDFLEGQYADHAWFPPDTKEKGEKMGAFFQGPAAPPKTASRIPNVVKLIAEKTEGTIQTWGALGMCWGGKIVSLVSQQGTPFKVVAEVHPAMVDPNDAKGITVPICMLASKDEDPDAVKGFEKELKVKSHVETFPDQVHGWMAARADLEDEKVKKEYERGYKVLLEFYHQYM